MSPRDPKAMPDWGRSDAWGGPTDWSMVMGTAEARTPAEAEELWRKLVDRYNHPIRLAVRRKLRGHSSADDVADSFFAYLFEGRVLAKADPDRGRFRCFLQGVLRNYVYQHLASEGRQKHAPLEHEVATTETPEIELQEETEWAEAVFRNAFKELERRNARGAELLMRANGLDPWPATSIAVLAEELDMKRNAVDQALFRARKLLRELLLEEIRSTVTSEEDYAQETTVIVARLLEAWSQVLADPKG